MFTEYLAFVFFLYYFAWEHFEKCMVFLDLISLLNFIVGIVFFSMIFYTNSQKFLIYKFEEAKDCSIVTGVSAYINKDELYTVLKVQFHDQNNVLRYGYGCMSNNSDPNHIDKLKYYEKGDAAPVDCKEENINSLKTDQKGYVSY